MAPALTSSPPRRKEHERVLVHLMLLQAGEPERAMAHYTSRGQLHLSDTRDQAAEQAVQTWAALTEGRNIRDIALIADAANTETDRLNARAQHLPPRIPTTDIAGAVDVAEATAGTKASRRWLRL
jgi:hypothetical protein